MKKFLNARRFAKNPADVISEFNCANAKKKSAAGGGCGPNPTCANP